LQFDAAGIMQSLCHGPDKETGADYWAMAGVDVPKKRANFSPNDDVTAF
jgi:hypothetical protein